MTIDATTHPFFGAGSMRGARVLSWAEGAGARAERAAAPATPSSARPRRPASSAKPVLILYDGSAGARRAIHHAGSVLGGGPALVACLWEPVDAGVLARSAAPTALGQLTELAWELEAAARARAERTALEGAALAGEVGLAARSLAVPGHAPLWRSVVELAEDEAPSALVMGARGRSCATALVAGSLSHAVINRAPCPVLVVGPHGADQALAPEPLSLSADALALREGEGVYGLDVQDACDRKEETSEPHPALA